MRTPARVRDMRLSFDFSMELPVQDKLVGILSTLHLYGPLKKLEAAVRTRLPGHRRREAEMLRFYSRFIREGDVCFDVGANAGNRTEIFLRLGARVIAVDPQPSCVHMLRKRFAGNPRVTVVPVALGAAEGEAQLLVSNASTISTLSGEFVEAVRKSGRFSAYRWDRKVTVPVTTLDRLIEKYGIPAFCKIDVEGYESQVLSGLARPIPAVSFEFVPEFIENALASIRRLEQAGVSRFNYSLGESMGLALSEWVSAEEMHGILCAMTEPEAWGDVYGMQESE